MSKLDRFLAKPKVYKIGEEEVTIHPLTVNDLDLLMQMEDKEKMPETIRELVKRTLAKAFPNETQEARDGFGLTYAQELMNCILEINGLKVEEKTEKKTLSNSDSDVAKSPSEEPKTIDT